MPYIHRDRAYKYQTQSQFTSYLYPSSPQAASASTQPPYTNILPRNHITRKYFIQIRHAIEPPTQSRPIEPPILFLMTILLIVLGLWLLYGIYYSVTRSLGRGVIRELDMNKDFDKDERRGRRGRGFSLSAWRRKFKGSEADRRRDARSELRWMGAVDDGSAAVEQKGGEAKEREVEVAGRRRSAV